MLSGKGYKKVYNLSGGIKAWNKEVAVGPQDSGMHLFDSDVSVQEAVIIGFGLEVGLREFYLSMEEKMRSNEAKNLFQALADVEIIHQENLVKLYTEVSGDNLDIETFQKTIVLPAMEGGITTDQYLSRFDISMENELDILSLAMAIEIQALDLYLRAADRCNRENTRKVLRMIADEERDHIAKLSHYIDQTGEV